MLSPTGGPFWRPVLTSPAEGLPKRVDVVVVGGGITGVTLARRLTADGARVAVLERGRLGSGATGRNAGFLLAGVAASYGEAAQRHGRAVAAEIWAFTLDNHRRLAEALSGADCGYRRGGSWVLPASPAERDVLLESAAMLAADGLPGEWRDEAPSSGAAVGGGLLSPSDGEVDPSLMLGALAAGLPAGVVFTGTTVLGVEASESGVRVHLERGEVEADRVVVALNGYTANLLPGVPIAPIRAQMMATAPQAVRIADRPVYSDHGYRYWRQLGDGRLLLGGLRNSAFAAEVGDDDTPSAELQVRLDGFASRLGVVAGVTHRWAGTMGFTPDELPLVGDVAGQPNVSVCGGYSGHGLGFAVGAAEGLVDSWSGGVIPAWLDSARFAGTDQTA